MFSPSCTCVKLSFDTNKIHSSINTDNIPFNIFDCISRKQFSIQKYWSNPSDGVVAMLQDHSKNGTFVNEKMLGSDVKSALKNEDIISIVYLTKDNERQQCNAFKFLASNSVLGSGNAKNETLVKFFSDDF